MVQLEIPGYLDWRVVLPLDPQPYLERSWGDWVWPSYPGMCAVSTHPERSLVYRAHCPFKVGLFYLEGVIEQIDLMQTSTGWVWVLHLRKASDEEPLLEAHWHLLQHGELKNCQWPDERDDDDL